MKRKCLVAALALTWCAAHAASAPAITIGSAAPLSGPQASFGQDNTDGVRLAIDDLNAQHVRIGGQPVVWKIDAEDDQADPRQATIIAQEFVDQKVNAVVGHMNSGCTFPASRVYERAGLPVITPSSTDPKIASQGFRVFFRIIANDNALGAGLAGYARNALHAKTVVVIDDRTAYGQGVADVFAKTATKAGLQVLDREYTNDKATDFSAILTKIKAAHPDIVFYGGMYGQAAPMLRQMTALGIRARFMGGDGVCAPELAKLAGPAADRTICADGGSPIAQMPGGPAWLKRYQAKFGGNAYQLYSPYAYDATMVLAQAMVKAGSSDPAKYLPMLREIHYKGVTNSDIHFDRNGNLADPVITLSTFEHGKKVMLAVENVH